MNQDEQIVFLNSTVKTKLGVSKIHGVGVVAITDIPKGVRLHINMPNPNPKFFNVPYGSLSKLFPEIKELILERWPSIINGSHFISPNDMAWMITFMNHSDEPNYDLKSDSTLKEIKKGEEITEDYRCMDNYEQIYPWLKR